MITKLTDENKNTIKNGVIYMRLSNNFTDSINVYDNSKKGMEENGLVKLGVINFVKKGKPIINKVIGGVAFYMDGFVFEPEPQTVIECKTFKHIARYVYDLNQQLKGYGRMGVMGNETVSR
jgi:hypothetical protein